MLYGRGPDTGISDDLSARLASLIMDAESSCSLVDARLSLAGALLSSMPQTSAVLIWHVLFDLALQKLRSLEMAIALLRAVQPDVESLSR